MSLRTMIFVSRMSCSHSNKMLSTTTVWSFGPWAAALSVLVTFTFLFEILPCVQGPLTMGVLPDLKARPYMARRPWHQTHRPSRLSIPRGTYHKYPSDIIYEKMLHSCVSCPKCYAPHSITSL